MLINCGDTPSKSKIELQAFIIQDGFQMELVASEPIIADPVAMEIDENGLTYVVEMHGYPLNTTGNGLVKLLFDDDNNGVFERSEIFYDQLVLPTGIMKWKKGVLVTDPPDLLYLEDTDGDGKADKREVVLTGFALSNPQHNFNSPIYGLDNWIYLANESTYKSQGFEDIFGDEGSEIYFPNIPDSPKLPRNANDLNLKVDLNNFRLEMLSGDSQFGHTFDTWGHHFVTKNWSHIYHEVLEAHYISRNQNLPIPTSLQYVPDYGLGFEIFPITQNPEHQLLTSVGAITSSCGITWYQGGLFPDPFQKVVLIAEPTHNLVHTDIVYDKGATFTSERQFNGKEFLASTDGWFRPVNFYIGPDGALYLLDFHRKIIEHPEWVSEEVLNSGELYEGHDKGRIFRITPKGTPVMNSTLGFDLENPEELIQALQNPNIWWRRHAQRLLVDRQNETDISRLKEFISETDELGLLHGLWTLEGFGHFDKNLVLTALDHAVAGIRENAIRIAELHRDGFPELEKKLISMTNDADPKVRFQLLCTLGYYRSDESIEARNALLFQYINDPWVQLAGLSASHVDPLLLFKKAALELAGKSSPGATSLFTNLSRSIGKRGSSNEMNELLRILTVSNYQEATWWQSASMWGLAESIISDEVNGIKEVHLNALAGFFEIGVESDLRSGSMALLNALRYFNQPGPLVSKAKSVAVDTGFSIPYRGDAVKILAWSDANGAIEVFKTILETDESNNLRSSAIWALGRTEGTAVCQYLIDQWKTLSPPDREAAIGVFLDSDARKMALLKAVDSKQIQTSSIDWSRTVSLLNSQNVDVREMARSVLEGNESISDSVWLAYQNVLAIDGTAAEGAKIYQRACSTCHQISGDNGVAFGPDLAAVRNRNKAGIMIDILKPNRSISDGFDFWTVTDGSGKVHTGIIIEESINAITLRNNQGEETALLRNEIQNKIAAEISAMPEGLHHQISQQEMADLLEYLKNGI